MKKFYISLIAVLVVMVSSCNRSQFSTTTRHYKNGKVTYTNHYYTERSRLSKGNPRKGHLNKTEAHNDTFASVIRYIQRSHEPEISKINPTQINDNNNFIVSTSNEPIIIAVKQSQVVPGNDYILSRENPKRSTIVYSHPVTLNSKDKKFKTPHAAAASTKKLEIYGLLGFIFSVFGWIPVIGFLFSIVGLVLSAVSLHKFKNNPQDYKGKGFAIAGLIIGILAFIFNIVYIIVLLSDLFSPIHFHLGV